MNLNVLVGSSSVPRALVRLAVLLSRTLFHSEPPVPVVPFPGKRLTRSICGAIKIPMRGGWNVTSGPWDYVELRLVLHSAFGVLHI